MRRMMLLLTAVGLMVSLAGCRLIHSHGICDCEDDNHCLERAPWLHTGTPIVPERVVVPPTKLLEGSRDE